LYAQIDALSRFVDYVGVVTVIMICLQGGVGGGDAEEE